MNAAMRCSCIYMSGGVVRGSTPGLTRQIPAAMLPTARSALSGQQLTSVRQRSRSAARKSVRAMAATATADSIYDFKVKVLTPFPHLPSLATHANASVSYHRTEALATSRAACWQCMHASAACLRTRPPCHFSKQTGATACVHPVRMQDIDGRNKALSAFKGKVLLVTNVASECGFTPQVRVVLGAHCLQCSLQTLEEGSSAPYGHVDETKYRRAAAQRVFPLRVPAAIQVHGPCLSICRAAMLWRIFGEERLRLQLQTIPHTSFR